MDGVIFKDSNFWLRLHEVFGTLEEGKKLTKKYLYTNYAKLVEEVVTKLWKGKDATSYYSLVKTIPYSDGVQELFRQIKKQDLLVAIVSSGSIDLARRAQHDLGIDFIYANELIIKNNLVTGEFVWPLGAGTEKKVEIISHLCKDLGIPPEEVIFIGDSESDIHACEYVGLSIAFNSKSKELKEAASHVVEGDDLRKVLPFLN